MLRRRFIAAMTALGVAFPLAGEQEKGKSKGGPGGRKTGSRAGVVVFGEQDKLILREYARRFGPNLPPGLAQRDDLPPGLEKQLVRKGHLPPGLEKRVVPFPPEIEQRLPVSKSSSSGKGICPRAWKNGSYPSRRKSSNGCRL